MSGIIEVIVLLSPWLLGLAAAVHLPPAMKQWIGALRRPEIDADRLTWQMRHVKAGTSWGRAAWFVLMGPVSVPPAALVAVSLIVFELPPAFAIAACGVPLLFLLAAPLWLLWHLPRAHSELRASADGLVWKRRWPLQSRAWAWQELVSVKVAVEALVLETHAGDRLSLPLPGVVPKHLRAAVRVLEATRTQPPPQPQPTPEIPAELRKMQRIGG